MADRTVTVKSSGGDYTSLNSAFSTEDDTYADLVTNTMILTFDCYNFEDTTGADTGTGYTTSSSYYLNVKANNSHGGKWSTSAYRHIMSLAINAYSLKCQEKYTRITGLQFKKTGGIESNSNGCIGVYSGSSSVTLVDSCIFTLPDNSAYNGNYSSGVQGAYNDTGTITVRNSLFYDINYGSTPYRTGAIGVHNNTLNIDNCTFCNITCPGGVIYVNSGTTTVRNCLFYNCSVDATGTITDTYCSTTNDNTKGLSSGGTGNRFSQTFTFVDSANKDFHLASNDAGALGYGTDLSGTFTTDIDGQTRSGTWDIGADEYVSAGVTIPLFLYHYRQRR